MEVVRLTIALFVSVVIVHVASQAHGLKIAYGPYDYQALVGMSATFECEATTESPLPFTIEWLHNGKDVDFTATESRYERDSDIRFTITRVTVEDSGIVTCLVRRNEVAVTANASLTVQDVPSPTRVVNVTCTDREATLRWLPTQDNGGTITGYLIQHNNSFTPDTWQDLANQVPASVTQYSIGLSPWMNYTFRVLAQNEVGLSHPSQPSTVCSTPPSVPYRNPGGLEGKGTQPNNIIISWDVMPKSEHNGPGFVYRVYWRPDIPGGQWSSADISNWRQNQMLIPDQPVFQRYRIKVAAYNRLGEAAPPEEFIGYSGEGVPTQAPTNLRILDITSRKLALSWDPVQPDTLRGHFKGYKIHAWTDEGGEKEVHETVIWSPTRTRAHINIAANSRMHVRVLAYNGRNNGPPSQTLSFDTPEGVPGSVRSLDAYPLGSSGFYLTWEPPYESNGELTGYKVYYQTVTGLKIGENFERVPQISDPQAKRAKLAGLKADTKYRLAIAARTKIGEGDRYFIEHRTGPDAAVKPNTPSLDWSQVSLKDGAASIRVTWLPYVQGHGGSHFYVKLRQKGETVYVKTQPEVREDFLIVRDLIPCQVYDVLVVAVDGEYETESPPSQVLVATDEDCTEGNELDVDSPVLG